MTESQLMYAAMLALTKQNMAFKLAPLSTAQMQGQVINRNIAVGETVVCWMNNSGELTRVGDVPAHNGDFFVDDNNLMYYAQKNSVGDSSDRLVIRDAFSGDIISDSEVCLCFVLSGDNQIAAYCIEESYDDPAYSKWIVIYKDGTRSNVITRDRPLFTAPSTPHYRNQFTFGYRNGVLAIANTRDYSGLYMSTYTKAGDIIETMAFTSTVYPGGDLICPINGNYVCVMQSESTNFWNVPYVRVKYYTKYGVTQYDPAEMGHYWATGDGVNSHWIGTDGVYCYLSMQQCENIAAEGESEEYVYIDAYDIFRVAIDSYSIEKIKTINGKVTFGTRWGTASTFGHMIQEVIENDVTTRTMIDITTMTDVYTSELNNLQKVNVQENAGWIWIPGSGVYQKTPLDWLMKATGEYPKDSPWGKCGYAIGDYKVGQNGLAIVLFE